MLGAAGGLGGGGAGLGAAGAAVGVAAGVAAGVEAGDAFAGLAVPGPGDAVPAVAGWAAACTCAAG